MNKQKGSPRSPSEAGFTGEAGLAPILIVLLIALAVGGYLIYQKQLKTLAPQLVIQQTPTPTFSPAQTTSDETANWKTYTNTEGKYTFKYPESYDLYENIYPPLITTDKSIPIKQNIVAKNTTFLRLNPVPETGRIFVMAIHYDVLDKKKSLEEITNDSCEYNSKAQSNPFTLGAKEAVIFVDRACAQSAGTVIYAVNGNYSYSIRMDYTSGIDSYDKFKKYADQILSTFKFLDKESVTRQSCGREGATDPEIPCPTGYTCQPVEGVADAAFCVKE